MNIAYLLIGGNMGDRLANLQSAREAIQAECGRLVAISPIYETAAWGLEDQPHFLNQAICIETLLAPQTLLKNLLAIEQSLGRLRQEKYGPRLIDIDILFYNNAVIAETGLQIPHPELQNRRFVLQPLSDIAAEVLHPVLHKTVHQLLLECPDTLEVHKFN